MTVITATNLSRSFGPVDLFSGINLSVPPRGRIAIVGPNGIGKTSLLRILAGEEQPTTNGWSELGSYLGYVHIKDARIADRSWRAAGEGDAQIPELLQAIEKTTYRGILAVEPHPFSVDGKGKISGVEGTSYAVESLRKVLKDLGYPESPQFRIA